MPFRKITIKISNHKVIAERKENLVTVDYSAQNKPPYRWEVYVETVAGAKINLAKGQGSWVEAMLRAQDIRKYLRLGSPTRTEARSKK